MLTVTAEAKFSLLLPFVFLIIPKKGAKSDFLVRAERKGGRTVKVTIVATVDQPLRLVNPFGKLDYKSSKLLEKSVDGDLQCRLKKGETICLNLLKAIKIFHHEVLI